MLLVDIGSVQFQSYKNTLLLTNKNIEKIIIESGSNSFHGINSSLIEKHFKKKTINLAEFAGVPLKLKLYRLSNAIKKGDVIILPLEYRYYLGDTTIDMFYDGIFFGYSHYFKALPFKEKIIFILNTPIKSTIKATIKIINKKYIKDYILAKFKNIQPNGIKEQGKLYVADNGDFDFKEPLAEKDDLKIPCQEYIFTKSIIDKNNIINPIFKDNIELLKNIKNKTGAEFVFTYPVVAGADDCYNFDNKNGKEFKNFLSSIKKYITNNGFKFIGNYQDSFFDKSHTMDTWFHVLPEARDKRTKMLIHTLEKENIISPIKK
ncbi:hypothetical protein LBC_02240 [Campylobacter sp. 19-13652]|nr:hypothetical protein LBC_02240 [Campylobacter sp. 19-13652]